MVGLGSRRGGVTRGEGAVRGGVLNRAPCRVWVAEVWLVANEGLSVRIVLAASGAMIWGLDLVGKDGRAVCSVEK